jgi:hypothetical protein
MFQISRSFLRRLALAVSYLLIAGSSPHLHAQNAGIQGSISGAVTDTSGAAIPGARISISSPDRTVVRETTTRQDGGFKVAGLPSGAYRFDITALGFSHYLNESVAVAVGRDQRVDVQLAPAKTSQLVKVHAHTAAMDISQSSPVTNIDRDRIEELPIPSRNYLSFTLLAPALAAANPVYGQQTPAATDGGFSAGGLRPSSNALYIDGSDDNDEYTGLSRTELSPEAISDFQVVNHGYAAESGGSAGASVEVETRSGENLRHGDAFLFVQNGALNATPPLENVPRKPDENRLRAGFSAGGPIQRNRLFYYLAAEQEYARGEEASDFGTKEAAAIDDSLGRVGPLRGFRLQQGFFPTTNQETEFSIRLDRAMPSSALMLRYALTNNRSVNDAFNLDDLSDLSARGSAFYNDNSLNGAWSKTLSPRLFSQFNFEVSQRRVAMRTASASGPGLVVAGIVQLGTPYAGNSRRYETHFDGNDDIVVQHEKHLYQAGIAFSDIAVRAADRDGFGGLYVFSSLAALENGQADFYTQSFGDPNTNFSEIRSAAFLQDHWMPLKNLTLDYGLRYEYNRLPASFPQDSDNVSPRIGFAFSPDKNWVARGGLGIFYDRYLLSTVNRIREFDGTAALEQIAEGDAAAAFYRSGIPVTAPHAVIAPSVWQPQPHLANPYSETASFGVEREFPSQWTADVEYRFVRGLNMGRTINSNLPPPVRLTPENAASLGIANPTPQQLGRFVFPPQRIDPAYDAVNQFQTEAHSNYNGLTVTVNRQFTEEFELMAGYTFSRTIDNASYDTEQPQNPYALADERALSLEDQRHRLVVSGLWVLGPDLDEPRNPAEKSSSSLLQKALTGLEFASILSVNSGFHDNPLTGVDSNREHIYPFAARPLGRARNSLQTPPNVNFDLRVLKMVPIWRGHLDIVAESFNLLNRQNTDLLNPVYGTASATTDTFGRPIQIADPRRIQFSLDYEY